MSLVSLPHDAAYIYNMYMYSHNDDDEEEDDDNRDVHHQQRPERCHDDTGYNHRDRLRIVKFNIVVAFIIKLFFIVTFANLQDQEISCST